MVTPRRFGLFRSLYFDRSAAPPLVYSTVQYPMAPQEVQSDPTVFDLQPLEDALDACGLTGIYTRPFIQQLSEDTARLRAGELTIAHLRSTSSAPIWLRNPFTSVSSPPNPGFRNYSGHWYNSYLRIAAHGYGKAPDLVVESRQHDGLIAPPTYAFDPAATCAPVQLTSHTPYQDDHLEQKQQIWAACQEVFLASRTRRLLQLQITSEHLRSGAPRIQKVVCMGLGTLTRQTGSLEGLDAKHRPYFQHIAALSIAQGLEQLYAQHQERYGEQKSGIRIFTQDPNYSNSDKTVLTENGITVLEDPNGLLAIDEHTFVMSAFPSFPLYEIIADMLPGGPAAIFDASLPTDGKLGSTMRCNEFAAPRVRKMLANYRIHRPKWDERELSVIHSKMEEALHWLPRMHLFFAAQKTSDAEECSPKVEEDIRRRQDLIDGMFLGGAQLLYQRVLRSVGF